MEGTDFIPLIRSASGMNSITSITDDDILREANLAYDQINDLHPWPVNREYHSDEYDANEDTYNLHTDARVLYVAVGGQALVLSEPFDPRNPTTWGGFGKPSYSFVDDGIIRLANIPVPSSLNSDPRLDYILQVDPAPLDEFNGPWFNSHYEMVIVYLAASNILFSRGTTGVKAQALASRADELIQRMYQRYMASNARGPFRLGGGV